MLTSPNSHLSQGVSCDFSVNDFLKLMTSSFIFASLPEQGKYFIPTVLPTVDVTESMTIPFVNDADHLILSWYMKPFPRGIFPALVVNLLCPENQLSFQLKRPLRSSPRYRNVITLHTNYGDVLLADGIAAYYSDPYKRCSTIQELVR